MIKSVNTRQWRRYLPLSLGTWEQRTWWPLSDSLWNSCIQAPGLVFHQHLHELSDSKCEFATYIPGCYFLRCGNTCRTERAFFCTQTPVLIFTRCVELLFYPIIISISLVSKWTLLCVDRTSPAQLMANIIFYNHKSSRPQSRERLTTNIWKILLRKEKERKWNSKSEGCLLCVLSSGVGLNHLS